MKQVEPGWEHYRTLLAVIKEGSLSAAARQLELTQPTVGRHIDALEKTLGLALFTRSQTGLVPTQSALMLAPHAENMASAAEALRRTATGEAAEDRGTIRITASEIVGTEVLPEMLTRFREAHPRIAIEVLISNRTEDLLQRDADIAIRMTRPTQNALMAKKIGAVNLALFAHRSYLEAHGTPKNLDDLSQHSLIGFDREPSMRRLKEVLGETLTREMFAFRCDSDVAQFAALKAGFGLGMCQRPLAGRYPDLKPVEGLDIQFSLDIWVVMHEGLKTSPTMRLMFDHLAVELGQYIKNA